MRTALVYITPAGGVGGEFPVPIPFRYPRRFVERYADNCRALGQSVRIVWQKGKPRRPPCRPSN